MTEKEGKKPYNTPQLTRHGSIEQITRSAPVFTGSGLAPDGDG